jgi:hypothetical protein
MEPPRYRPGYRPAFTKSDTTGEVSFAGICPLTHPVFRLVPKVNRASYRLRQQYQKCARAQFNFQNTPRQPILNAGYTNDPFA